jgi:RHS repeat-associated protein
MVATLAAAVVSSLALGSAFGSAASALAPVPSTGVSHHNGGLLPEFTESESLYTPGQLYGDANSAATCYTCEAADITGTAPPSESLDGGSGVNTLTGDFNTSNTLFNIAGGESPFGLKLSYDAELAQAEVAVDANGQFGTGWSSNLDASITEWYGDSVPSELTVNDGTGSESEFTQSPSGGTSTSCTGSGYAGDNPSALKYTGSITGETSNHYWCALESVQAQLDDYYSEDAMYQEDGGKLIQEFNWDGSFGVESTTRSLSYGPLLIKYYDVAPGSAPLTGTTACPTYAYECTVIEMYAESSWHDEIEVLNYANLVTQVIDPAGVTYDLSYDGDNNLTSIENYANQSSPSTWNFVYSTGAGSPYDSDLATIEDPDYTSGTAHTTSVAYNTSGTYKGMASSLTDGTGYDTTYSYDYACSMGQCLGAGDPQATTVTYPAQIPSPGATAVSPVEVDTYDGGVESSTSLGSPSDSDNNETWTYSWSFGYGSSNSTESITYPNSLGGTAPSATIILDTANNVYQTENSLGDWATSMYNDAGSNNLNELVWSYPGESSNSLSDPPTGAYVYTYNSLGQVQTQTDPLGNVTNYGYYEYGNELCYVAPPTVSISGTPPSCGLGIVGPSPDAPAGATAFSYDVNDNVAGAYLDYSDTATGSDPQTTTADYNVMGDLLWSIPPAGQSGSQSTSNAYATVDTYTPANLLATSIPPGEGTSTFTYDADLNRLTEESAAATTTNVYDGDNRACYTVTSSSAVSGLSCSTGYQEGSTATSYVPGSTNVFSNTDSLGNVTHYYYEDLAYPNSPTEIVDPADDAIQYTAYDDFGNVCVTGDVSLASQQGEWNQCATMSGDTSTVHNSLGDETSMTDPGGNTTSNEFTDTSYPTLETSTANALAEETQYAYNADGNLVITTNPDGSSVKTAYDADGRICTTSDNGTSYSCGSGTDVSGVTTYTYNGASERLSMTTYSPSAATTAYSYTNGDLQSTVDSNDKTVSYLYNYDGQVICEAYPLDVTTGCGTISSPASGSPTNTIVTRAYDSAGRLHTVTDWMSTNNTTTYTYGDAWTPSSPTSVASSGASADYGYNNNGEPTSLSAGSAIDDSETYDSDKREATTEVNGSTSASTTYNANSQITAATNLGSSTSNDTYTVAANGEITKDVPPSGSTTSFAYNTGDELCWLANVSSTASCTSPPTATVETNYTYTANGERASAATTTGSGTTTTDYAWNPLGQLCNVSTTISTSCGSTPTNGTSYSYNGDGLRMTSTKVSGSSGSSSISAVGSLAENSGTGKTTLSVDPVTVGDAFVLGVDLESSSLTVSSVSGGGATWTKLTNAPDNPDEELWLGTITATGSSTITVTYSGSVTSTTTELDAQEYTNGTGSSTTWTKDVVGTSNNTTSSTTVTFPSLTPSSTHELYVGMGQVATSGEAGSTSDFTYDVTSPLGNLYIYNPSVSASVSPTATQISSGTSVTAGALIEASGSSGSSSSSTTNSTWDVVSGGSIPLNVNDATTSGSSTTNVSYIYGDLLFGGTAPVEQITTTSSGSTAVFLVANPTGVQGVFSSAGATDELAVYSTYGKQTITSGTEVTPFGFQGSYTDATGLIYLINRYYDPTTDQFLSIDPEVAETDQPYVYTGDDPLNEEDPLGLSPATNALAIAESTLRADEYIAITSPTPADIAAVRALAERVSSDEAKVNSDSSGSSTKQTPSQVTSQQLLKLDGLSQSSSSGETITAIRNTKTGETTTSVSGAGVCRGSEFFAGAALSVAGGEIIGGVAFSPESGGASLLVAGYGLVAFAAGFLTALSGGGVLPSFCDG